MAGQRHSCSVIRSERSGDNNDRPCDTSAPRKQFQLVTRHRLATLTRTCAYET